MQKCPHCSAEIIIRKLPHQGLFKSYRICPKCGGSFTVDTHTKYRQAISLVIALISLVFTILLYLGDKGWLIPAIGSYAVLGLLIYWGNKKVFFVPYKRSRNSTNDT
jgi:ribosomal protein S27AE